MNSNDLYPQDLRITILSPKNKRKKEKSKKNIDI